MIASGLDASLTLTFTFAGPPLLVETLYCLGAFALRFGDTISSSSSTSCISTKNSSSDSTPSGTGISSSSPEGVLTKRTWSRPPTKPAGQVTVRRSGLERSLALTITVPEPPLDVETEYFVACSCSPCTIPSVCAASCSNSAAFSSHVLNSPEPAAGPPPAELAADFDAGFSGAGAVDVGCACSRGTVSGCFGCCGCFVDFALTISAFGNGSLAGLDCSGTAKLGPARSFLSRPVLRRSSTASRTSPSAFFNAWFTSPIVG